MVSLRKDAPEVWVEFTSNIREVVGNWTDDQIAAVASKVQATSPDRLLDSIAEVFVYCAAALSSGNEEAIATVEIWQMKDLPIEIMVDEGGVSHRLSPDVDVEIVQP